MNIKTIRYTTPSGNLFVARDTTGEIGVGSTKQRAKNNLGAHECVPWFEEKHQPFVGQLHLIVGGTNTYIRKCVPRFILQQYDLYLCKLGSDFGLILISRLYPGMEPLYIMGPSIKKVLEYSVVVVAGTLEFEPTKSDKTRSLWLMNWLYRQPKLSMNKFKECA